MGFPRQEYWSGLPFPSSGDLPSPGTETESPALSGRFFFFLPLRHWGSPNFIVVTYIQRSLSLGFCFLAKQAKTCLWGDGSSAHVQCGLRGFSPLLADADRQEKAAQPSSPLKSTIKWLRDFDVSAFPAISSQGGMSYSGKWISKGFQQLVC